MKALKRFIGIIWMALGPLVIVLLSMQALDKIKLAQNTPHYTNTMLQWGIILFIFMPICAGLVIFGYYAVKGDYDKID